MHLTPSRRARACGASQYVQPFIRTEMSISSEKLERLERGTALCDFWLSPLATSPSLPLDTLPGCPLARHLFRLPPRSPPLLPPFPGAARPAMSRCDALIDALVTHAPGNLRRPNRGEVFLFLKQQMLEACAEERGFLEGVSEIDVGSDGPRLERLSPAVIRVAVARTLRRRS